MGSSYFLSYLPLPSIGWLTTLGIETCMVKVWIGKGMILKLVPPLSGLTGLVTSCTIDGVVGILLLVPISTYTKFGGSYLKSGKTSCRLVVRVDNSIHQSKPTPYCHGSAPLWTLGWFATTPSTWGFYFPRLGFAPWIRYFLASNSSNSFNLLFILIGRMGLSLFNCTLVVSYLPFQSWIWIVRLCFCLSNSMWATTYYSLRSWQVRSKPCCSKLDYSILA
jgi:hypothetical protein